ncbi:MAG: methyltransferase domain-containing protein [Saprospiraceae bacterium]
MAAKNNDDYILGTDRAELHRLGLQHQVWSEEAREGWKLAEFGAGQTLLDLGCGPGFCTTELAYIVGEFGKVIGVDLSKTYIDFLQKNSDLHGLPIEGVCSDFMEMKLKNESLDGAYSRWALAWVEDAEEVIGKVADALVPGGAFVAQEYYDWSTFQTEPVFESLNAGIAGALKSFKSMDSEIDIGKKLPELFYNNGLEVISIRPMTKMATPESLIWQWPKSFMKIYLPKIAEMGFITKQQAEDAFEELLELENTPGATILCPHMIEVIGIKV